MDAGQIDRLVRERFPKLESEFRCRTEKLMRDAARQAYRQRLMNEFQSAEKILATVGEAAPEIRVGICPAHKKDL